MNRRDLKIIWSSNAPYSNSGYARFTDDWSQRVLKDGWPIRLVAWAGLGGGSIEYKGIYNYPQTVSVWGEDALFDHGNHFGANVRFSMQDVHAMNPQWLGQMNNWIPYTPIDRWEIQSQVLSNLQFAYKIITFSKFGQKALENKGFASTMIPEGVDTSVFKPLDKMKIRDELKWPKDKIIVGMIGANKDGWLPRKSWQQALDAFKLFNEKHPDSMFFHEFNQSGGFDIVGYAQHLGILEKIIGFDAYTAIMHGSPELVNKWLNGMDFLLHPSSTEGFGLVIPEAQAAGTPVIIQNIMSMPELIVEGKTGFGCKTATKLWAPGGGYVFVPDVDSIADCMEKTYDLVKKDENKVSSSCRAWVKGNYDIDTLFKDRWLPYLEELQNEFLPVLDEAKK